MSRSQVALLIVVTAILGYLSMVGVAIFTRGELDQEFDQPRDVITTPSEQSFTTPAELRMDREADSSD